MASPYLIAARVASHLSRQLFEVNHWNEEHGKDNAAAEMSTYRFVEDNQLLFRATLQPEQPIALQEQVRRSTRRAFPMAPQ